MIRKMTVSAVVAFTAGLLFAAVADAQQVQYGDPDMEVNGSPVMTASTSGVSGTIVSAAATLNNGGGGVSTVLYTTPSDGQFILTQVCRTSSQGAVDPISVQYLGDIGGIAIDPDNDKTECTEYVPGLALPQSSTVTVRATGYLGYARTIWTITGVHQS